MPKLSDLFACTSSTICFHDAPRRSQDAHKTGQGGSQDTRRRTPNAPKTPPARFQNGPRCPQNGPKTPDDAIRTLQDNPKMLQDVPKTRQDASRPRFSCLGTWISQAFKHPRPDPEPPEALFCLVARSLADGVSDHIRGAPSVVWRSLIRSRQKVSNRRSVIPT